MTFRYYALTWDATDEAAANHASEVIPYIQAKLEGWSCVANVDGLFVCCSGLVENCWEATSLGNSHGVVLGKVFRKTLRESGYERFQWSEQDVAQTVATGGKFLTDHCWGRYVAFVRERESSRIYVVRDPQGAIPCLVTRFHELTMIFSNADDCVALNLLRFSINWRYVGAWMVYQSSRTPETGLNEVTELGPGECLEVSPRQPSKIHVYWDPVRIARSNSVEDEQEAIESLRHVTRACVWAWATCYPRIIHRLSGGLDSSIVLSCLSSAPARPAVTCTNYFVRSRAREDERRFARMAANAAECELLEVEHNPGKVDLRKLTHPPRLARPITFIANALRSEEEARVAEQRRALATFCGVGGDQLFFRGPLLFAVADCLKRFGLRGAFFTFARETATAERASFWRLLSAGVRLTLSRQWEPWTQAGSNLHLIAGDALKAARCPESPFKNWLKSVADLPPGKRHQVQATPLAPPPVAQEGPEVICPLVSQPLIELTLRIPTYLLAAHGISRGAARRSFAPDVPAPILRRRTKGGVDSYLHELFENNLEFLREMMLDGALVKERLLDRGRLERALSRSGQCSTFEATEILCEHLNAEVWARSWLN